MKYRKNKKVHRHIDLKMAGRLFLLLLIPIQHTFLWSNVATNVILATKPTTTKNQSNYVVHFKCDRHNVIKNFKEGECIK